MGQPDFESMSNRELINCHLEKGQQSEALSISIYVRRLNKDSRTVWVKPEDSMEELDDLMQSLQSKNQNKI